MSRRTKTGAPVNHDRWLISYADFITLLFAFFVVMFASSQTDKTKAKQVSDSVREALQKGGIASAVHEILGGSVDEKGKGNAQMKGPGGAHKIATPPADERDAVVELLPSLQYLNHKLEEEIRTGKMQVSLQPRGLVVSLREATFFPSGEDGIAPETYGSVEKVALMIRELPNAVRLEGHTDSVPIHTLHFHNNWELSSARAIAMLQLMSTRFQIPPTRLAIAGYADTMPIDTNDSLEGRAHNRRVDILILSQHNLSNKPLPEPGHGRS